MFHHFDTITTTTGDALAGWQVEAVVVGTSTIVPIFADEISTPIFNVSGVTNRAVSDSDGNYDFFIPDGDYSLRFYDASGNFQKEQRRLSMYGSLGASNALRAELASQSAGEGAELVAYRPTGSILSENVQDAISEVDTNASALRTELAGDSGAELVAFKPTNGIRRSIGSRLRDTINVRDFGAVGDGVTNDRAAIAAAVQEGRGRQIIFPEGNYLIDTNGGSITLEEVELCGEGVLDGATGSIDQGVNLWITGTTNSAFKMRRGTSVRGLGFYYPSQVDSASPTVYPDTFALDFTAGAVQFCRIENNVVYNPYRFITIDDAGAGNVGHIEIEGNYVCALNRGIYISHNLEHIRINRNNFTFGFWLAATESGSRGYMRANATAIQVQKSDGVEIIDNLFYGYLDAVKTSATGLCQFMTIQQNKFDQVRNAVKAAGAGNFSGTISGNTFNCFNSQNTAAQGRSISIETNGTGRESITITGNNFLLATEDHIYTSGNAATRNIVVGPQNFVSWAAYKTSGSYGALNINGTLTNLDISGGWQVGSNAAPYSYGIMGNFNTLNCTGVTFDGCQRVLSVTVNSLVGSGNVSFGTGHSVADVYTATTKAWGPNRFDKPQDKTPLTLTIGDVPSFANDAAAAGGGVPVGGFYRNGSAFMIRAA